MVTSTLKYEHHGEQVVVDLLRSAPNQIRPFPRIEEVCSHWKQKGYREVIDVGCGWLRNSLVLVNHFALWICDFPEQLARPVVSRRLAELRVNSNFRGVLDADEFPNGPIQADAAVIAFVLHTLPEEALRAQLINSTVTSTQSPHEILIAVPNAEYYYRQRMGDGNRFSDGHLFGAGQRKTFYREYTAAQIDEFMARLGFSVEGIFTADKKNQRTYIRS
jgi:hypothetical protein